MSNLTNSLSALKPAAISKTIKEILPLILVVIYMMASGNVSLFSRILDIYPLTIGNFPFLVSIFLFFSLLTLMFFVAISHGKYTRWILALFVILASQAAYYMDQFGVIIDMVMIDNIAQTSQQEMAGLFTTKLMLRTIILGLLPAWLIIKFYPTTETFSLSIKSKLKMLGQFSFILVLLVLPFLFTYITFVREHKITRFYANPTYMAYSGFKFIKSQLSFEKDYTLKKIAKDAVKLESDDSKPELMIMVVGETARFDRFSLNGYHKETNPLLKNQDVISFSNVTSCGTSTSVSVPCMFSAFSRRKYDKESGLKQQNALEVLADHGVEVLWRDNNSDSKGVAIRLPYEDYKSPSLNTVCEGECRDIGMLKGLDQYIEARKDKEILIVLHQMGNHGPEYYRRYPKEFAKFQPMCMTGELKDCAQEDADNSYDNAILYTDYFLSNVIDLLKKYDDTHATAMFYVSDHGESLGEEGFYLHAAPYKIAPKEQTHVPAIMWMGEHFHYSMEQLMPFKDAELSHDDLFCSLLVAFELDTQLCESKKTMLMANKHLTKQP